MLELRLVDVRSVCLCVCVCVADTKPRDYAVSIYSGNCVLFRVMSNFLRVCTSTFKTFLIGFEKPMGMCFKPFFSSSHVWIYFVVYFIIINIHKLILFIPACEKGETRHRYS